MGEQNTAFTPRVIALLEYCRCLYRLEECGCGGLLHIWLDDGNDGYCDVMFCLKQCEENPSCEHSELGILICKKWLQLSEDEQLAFQKRWQELYPVIT